MQVEFPPVFAEEHVNVDFSQLYARCKYGDHTEVITMSENGYPHTDSGEETETLKLDNDGNAFMILIGNASCASGTSLIEASLESAPYTTYTTNFTVNPPATDVPQLGTSEQAGKPVSLSPRAPGATAPGALGL